MGWIIQYMIGQKIGSFTFLKEVERVTVHRRALFKCYCGKEFEADICSITNQGQKSCGCWNIQALKNRKTTHGHTAGKIVTPEYRAWCNIKERCYKKKTINYCNYGGRGIRMCRKWKYSFELFLSDVGPRPSKNHSIDRIRNDGNYEPGNVKWSTRKEQCRNRRSTRIYNYKGKAKSIVEWAEEKRIGYFTLIKRIDNGWMIGEAIETPVRKIKIANYANA